MATTLTFQKVEAKGYAATVTVNSDFNLHVERNKPGFIMIYGSTVNNGAKAKLYESYEQEANVDYDFDGVIYPKYITIYSETPVTSGTITEL